MGHIQYPNNKESDCACRDLFLCCGPSTKSSLFEALVPSELVYPRGLRYRMI